MSVIPLKADIHQRGLHVRFVPEADIQVLCLCTAEPKSSRKSMAMTRLGRQPTPWDRVMKKGPARGACPFG